MTIRFNAGGLLPPDGSRPDKAWGSGLPVMLRQRLDLAFNVWLQGEPLFGRLPEGFVPLLEENRLPINLAEQVGKWPVRDQGASKTCVAHAVGAAIELQRALSARTPPEPLSAGYLYWGMRNHPPPGGVPGWTAGNTRFDCAVSALEQEGLCKLDLCPDELNGPVPSPAAIKSAVTLEDLRSAVSEVPGQPAIGDDHDAVIRNFKNIVVDELYASRAVCMGFPVVATGSGSTNWNDAGESDGTVRFAPGLKPSDYIDGHAVCITGFMPDDAAETEGGYFLFRNSQGLDFGARRAVPGVTGYGYGRVSVRDAVEQCWDYFTLRPIARFERS